MMLEDRSERVGLVEALLFKPEFLVELIQDLWQLFRTSLTASLECALKLLRFSSNSPLSGMERVHRTSAPEDSQLVSQLAMVPLPREHTWPCLATNNRPCLVVFG
jgi:hypothetical protein